MISTDRVAMGRAWAIALMMGCVGCAPGMWGVQPVSDESQRPLAFDSTTLLSTGGPELFYANRTGAQPDQVVVVQMQFEVLRVSIPTGASEDLWDEVWRYVDELRTDPERTAHLARNGFRIGVGQRSDWSGLRAALEEIGARSEHVRRTVRSGYPLSLDLGLVGDEESVFILKPNGRLVGKTFDGGRKYLHVDYHVGSARSARTTLRITPEIFKESDQRRWRSVEGQPRYDKQYAGYVYRELSSEFSVGPGEFLVVGPVRNDDNRFILGTVMLREKAEGRALDTLFLITPQPYRMGGGPDGG